MPLHIELIETERGGFTVLAGEQFAAYLGRDEALGVIAALLFGGTHCPPYLRTYEGWAAWNRRYCPSEIQPVAALLSWQGRAN